MKADCDDVSDSIILSLEMFFAEASILFSAIVSCAVYNCNY
jgi:hypothetical protein